MGREGFLTQLIVYTPSFCSPTSYFNYLILDYQSTHFILAFDLLYMNSSC